MELGGSRSISTTHDHRPQTRCLIKRRKLACSSRSPAVTFHRHVGLLAQRFWGQVAVVTRIGFRCECWRRVALQTLTAPVRQPRLSRLSLPAPPAAPTGHATRGFPPARLSSRIRVRTELYLLKINDEMQNHCIFAPGSDCWYVPSGAKIAQWLCISSIKMQHFTGCCPTQACR